MNAPARPKRTLGRLLLRGLLAVLLLAGIALLGVYYALHWRPSVETYPMQGVDVSHHQSEIHWPTLHAAGADFAYIKATEGGDFRDPDFARNWQETAATGMKRGAYHFFTLCTLAADQATNFIATVPRDPAALPPAVDLEFGGNCAARPSRDVLIGELTRFLTAIEAHSGKPAILYLTREFDDAYQVSDAFDRSLWLRRLAFPPDYGARPWVMWQATNIRRVEGVEGPIDWNVVRP